MDLKTYLKKKKLTARDFAKIAGLSESSVGKYLLKKRLPDLMCCVKIEDATQGKVTIKELIAYFKSEKGETDDNPHG